MSRVECDKARCSGCLACIVACLDQHYDEADGYAVPARIYEMQKSGDSDLEIYVPVLMMCQDLILNIKLSNVTVAL